MYETDLLVLLCKARIDEFCAQTGLTHSLLNLGLGYLYQGLGGGMGHS